MEDVKADLSDILNPDLKEERERFEAFYDGGGGMVSRPDVRESGTMARTADGALDLTFSKIAGTLEASPHALKLPESWEGFHSMAVALRNGNQPAELTVTIVGARNRLIQTRRFAAGENAQIVTDLVDLPLAQGLRPPYRPAAIRISASWGGVHQTEGERAMAGTPPATDTPLTVRLSEIRLIAATDANQRPCVDRFCQRVNGDWPTKIRSEEHLRSVIEEENAMLEAARPWPDRDIYGGWTAGPTFEAGGFFRVDQDKDGRWWYVDPLGNPFWSFGVTGVRSAEPNTLAWTRVQGREHLFEELPDPNSKIGKQVYCEKGFSCYGWNILRKWGSKERWRDQVLARFGAWGINTVANWSEEIMLRQQTIPFVRALDMPRDGVPTLGPHMPDAWDPKWAEALDTFFEERAAPERDNPWLLGYFVDNEIGWPAVLPLRGASGSAARKRWLAFLQERYDSPEKCARALDIPCSTWSEIESVPMETVAIEGQAGDLLHELTGEHAELYFSTIARLLKKHDPNHLYMGCRFTRRKKHRLVVEACGRHCDVLSFNYYGLAPRAEEVRGWYEESGKPLQIGEHHIPLLSERQLAPLYPAFTEEERRVLVPRYVETWSSQPYAVGSHWYQHCDQMPTGRYTNGENQTVGLMDITDQPHPELVEAFKEIAVQVYQWHNAAR